MEQSEHERYEPGAVEAKWQEAWAAEGAFTIPNPDPTAPDTRPSTYVLEMLPYPSGELHMGHVFNYTMGDVLTHIRRRQGMTVLRPMGYDAFGLPAENAAIIRRILEGERGPRRDIVLLNAGAALLVAGRVTGVREGIAEHGRAHLYELLKLVPVTRRERS